MVAYSFNRRFVEPIDNGTKSQTIRALSKRRHVRPGETMQIYSGMRTKYCRLIGTAICASVNPVRLQLRSQDPRAIITNDSGAPTTIFRGALDEFAVADGFRDWPDMLLFWALNHEGVEDFSGVLIRWKNYRSASQSETVE